MDVRPPAAPRRPRALRAHGDERVDDWFWLRERDNSEVRAYLEAENAYTEAATAHLRELEERLYAEYRSRIQETDETVPARRDDRWYYRRTVEGLEYQIHCRRTGAEDAPEEVLLDENELARAHDYLDVGDVAVSPDHRLLAYTVDTTGAERFTLRIRELDGRRDVEEVPDVYYGLAWASDNATVFYTRPNEAMRPWQLWRHRLGTPARDDVLVLQEDDERFYVSVFRTRSGAFVVVPRASMVTSDAAVIPAGAPEAEPRVLRPRRQGVEYRVEDDGERFLLVTNDGAPNFRLVDEDGRELLPHRDDVRIESATALAGHLVVTERADAVLRLRVDGDVLEQPEEAYTATPGENLAFGTDTFRYEYGSLVTPPTVYDLDLQTGERRLLKRHPVPGYEPDLYASERLWASADDGERVPISLVYRRDRPRDPAGPLLLYGYGAYEFSLDPRFSPYRLSLLDRGVAFAIAHVRGGGELGRRWYENGKLEHKPNTFTDLIACAEHLISEGWAAPDRLALRGGSAGGLLVGAVVNMRPDLFGCVVMEVPFVDVLTTILDQTLPLTAVEWEEWGDPVREERFYRLLKSYSPYDNIRPQEYPPMLVTAGFSDPRVGYWEPAKWVAKLRATKTDSNRLLFRARLGSGHAGPSGRYERWREEAFVQAFLLDTLGLT
jgi:oligopeptidase B